MRKIHDSDDKTVYCICPSCKSRREKINGNYTIIKRGYERDKTARFFCNNCKTWFNEKTGESMSWLNR